MSPVWPVNYLPVPKIVLPTDSSTNLNTTTQIQLEMGLRAHADGDLDSAKLFYEKVLSVDPNCILALGWLGTIEAQRKNFSIARPLLERALASGHDPDFLLNYANLLQATYHYEQAVEIYLKMIKIRCSQIALSNLAACYNELKQSDKSLYFSDKALSIDPNYAEAWSNRGIALNDLKRHEEALASCERSIELKPDCAEAWSNRGNALNDLKRHEEALVSCERSIKLKPDCAEAWSNRGIALNNLRRHEEALASCERSIELKPSSAEAWSNRGNTLRDLRRHEEALTSYERSIKLKPDYAEAWSNRGIALNDLKRYEEALASYERSIKLKPDSDYILGNLLHTQMKICDWADLDGRCQTLGGLLTANRASSPFAVLGLFDDPLLQQQCAELHAKSKFNFNNERRLITKEGRRDPKNKIRVGYFSADFHDHATMYLMAELFDCHDRGKFEVFGFSFGPKKDDAMRNRAQKGLDSFFDVSSLSDPNVAALARAQQIDIAVDLKGYTQDSRPAIFGHGAAPIQINYLGFPGTMGTPAIDYLIADRVLIPDNLKSAYSEKIIYLPNSYQVNDSKRKISDRAFTREELGLPESSFVYCCFNNNWKILPEIFDTWVRITQRVPNSVLWLYEDNPTAALNLKAQAKRQKLDPSRLVFARHLPHAEHLARYRLADLFLDTFPCTAHTTASDALWAGLPVLTRFGKSFASRVASSLLHGAGLPELITHTTEEYESLAIDLAKNSGKISSLKARLANNRATCPLFNTALFTQHIESAYQAVYERYHGGLAPEHIYVS